MPAPPIRVASRQELRAAVVSEAACILVDDTEIARSIRAIKSVPEPILGRAVAVPPSFIPASLVLAFALAFLLIAVGVTVIWAIYKDYDIDVTGNIDIPGKSGDGKIILRRKPAG